MFLHDLLIPLENLDGVPAEIALRYLALDGFLNVGQGVFHAAGEHMGQFPGLFPLGQSHGIQDLPGIYSLSPYTLEEVVARSYLVNEKPDAILNIVDGTNIERNLYLTTQLIELGPPSSLR